MKTDMGRAKKIAGRILILAMVTALPILAAAAAGAAPERDCSDLKWADHPTCQTTTTTAEPPVAEPCPTPESPDDRSVVSIGGSGSITFECDWTPVHDESATHGRVSVARISGEVSRLVVFVRDSSPGDICVLEEWDRPPTDQLEASFPLTLGNETYWETPTHWCSHFDPIAGTRDDLNGDAFHLTVNLRGKKDTFVEIRLTPYQAS